MLCRFISYLGYLSCSICLDSKPKMHNCQAEVAARVGHQEQFSIPGDSKENGVIEPSDSSAMFFCINLRSLVRSRLYC